MQPALAPAPHPSMQTSAQDHADQVLHDSLLAAQHLSQHPQHPQQPRPPQPNAQPHHLQPTATSPRDQNNIDPAISGGAMLPPSQPPTQPEPPVEDESPKTYGKRPLSTSKRAAQNRAAQRAFRQRKESYIRKLEEQVKEYEVMSQEFKALQAENYQLREYVINLQSRLLDSQGEVPELPGNIDLNQPRAEISVPQPATRPGQGVAAPPQGSPQSQVSIANDDMNSLNRIAEAGLGMRKHPNEEAFLNNSFQARRGRGDEAADSPDTKTEPQTHGLPMVS
ncbi:putative transcription factor kapC [Aspergillus multicolor]|uniref:putative transcription factor kapC n=1 Tax=Aspergillus multicolor TaxID=41759 RepID=UPI003CCCE14A